MDLKKLTSGIVLILLALSLSSCGSNENKTDKKTPVIAAASIEVSIGGMSCSGCEQTIQTNIGKLEGIKSVKASFKTGNAVIEYIPGKVDSLKIKEAITASGYTVGKFSDVHTQEASK
jgi:copper chaperone CopZ